MILCWKHVSYNWLFKDVEIMSHFGVWTVWLLLAGSTQCSQFSKLYLNMFWKIYIVICFLVNFVARSYYCLFCLENIKCCRRWLRGRHSHTTHSVCQDIYELQAKWDSPKQLYTQKFLCRHSHLLPWYFLTSLSFQHYCFDPLSKEHALYMHRTQASGWNKPTRLGHIITNPQHHKTNAFLESIAVII